MLFAADKDGGKMNNLYRIILKVIEIVLIIVVLFFALFICETAFAEEEEEEPVYLYVMAKSLNGRIRPGKRYQTIVEFEMDTPLVPTGRWSKDHMWVEVVSAENDYVWCNVNYLTERREVIHVYSLNSGRIKIRKAPGHGRVTGYAREGEVLEITQVVMGYGKCSKGWVDLSYFIEDCE